MKHPTSMEELVYFTNRNIGDGKAKVWVFKKNCPDCKVLMGKPKGADGSIKIRAKEYVCEQCGRREEKKAYEESLNACAAYTCPACKHEGEIEFPFKRKTFQGVKALVFECQECGEKIGVTKKMKKPKK